MPWWVWVSLAVICLIIVAVINSAGSSHPSSGWHPPEEAKKPQGPAGQALARFEYQISLIHQLGHPPSFLYNYLVEEMEAGRMKETWVTLGILEDLANNPSPKLYDSTVSLIHARISRDAVAELTY